MVGFWTKFNVKLSLTVACFDIMNNYLKTFERYGENTLVAILPGVDFSLGLPSKDILKQLRLDLALDLNDVQNFRGIGITHPPCVRQLTQHTTDAGVVL